MNIKKVVERIKKWKWKWKRIGVVTIILILVLAVAGLISILVYSHKSKTYNHNHKIEVELQYWSCKAAVVDEMTAYMNSKVATHNVSALVMLNACDKYNIDVRLPLAQGLLESHYGTAGLARKTNSVFNMGAYDGRRFDEILGIFKYAHPNQSIEPYCEKLRETYLGNTKTEEDLMKNFVTLGGKRYATYEKYEEEVRYTWNEINLTTKLDSLLQAYQYLKVEIGR